MNFIINFLIILICTYLNVSVIFAADEQKNETKISDVEVSGVLERGPINYGAKKALKIFQIKTSENQIVILPSFIDGKQVEFEKLLGVKVIAKGKGTVDMKSNEKGEVIKTSIFTQLQSIEFADLKTKSTPDKGTSLPKVLIIGDSISLGYTNPVKKNLEGIAEVSRPGTNCQHTGYGLEQIKNWIGTTKWDVIHFNFGIWDTHLLDANNNIVHPDPAAGNVHIRFTPEQYKENLTQIVKILKGTGAKIIWASTTPIMIRTGARFEVIPNNNKIAATIMKENGIAIDDLYEFVIKNVKEWQTADQVHFNPLGNIELGKQVTKSIVNTIKKK